MRHEQLEPRQLLSVSLSSGVLTILGTSRPDSITAQQTSTSIIVSDNGVVSSIAKSKVTSLSVSLGGGNDFFAMQKKSGTRIVRIPATISGGSGNDILRGGARNDSLIGGNGNDTLDGGTGADALMGGPGTDTADYSARVNAVFIEVDGRSNDGEFNEHDDVSTERVIGGAGDDTFKISPADSGNEFFGGPATDAVDYRAVTNATHTINISLDDLPNDGANGKDNVHSDIENVIGSPLPDSITGSAGANSLVGNAGDDTLLGGAGEDFLAGGVGRDSLDGGPGVDTDSAVDPANGNVDDADTITASNDDYDIIASDKFDLLPTHEFVPETINGTSGNDLIIVTQTALDVNIDVNGQVRTEPTVEYLDIECGGGNDRVVLSKSDGSKAFRGNAFIDGAAGKDTIQGGLGNDTLFGGSGNDKLFAGAGNDSLSGGAGNDALSGDAGNDALNGGGGSNDMSGGPGNDTADYSAVTFNLHITLDDDLPNDGTAGQLDNVHSDIENVFAGSGDDTIVGNSSANFISGGAGDDSLAGEKGLDKLVGGAGSDTMYGNGDIDLLLATDGGPDDFDTALDADRHPLIDFVSGDSRVDFSLSSQRSLG